VSNASPPDKEVVVADQATLDVDVGRFQHQLDIIRKRDPQLAEAIEQADDDGMTVIPTRDGSATLQVRTDAGNQILLHSKYGPQREAAALVDQHPTGEMTSYVVFGFGMGHHVRELFRRASPESILIVFENSPAVLRQALLHNDFSDMLSAQRFMLFADVGKAAMINRLNPYVASLFLGLRYVPHPPSLQAQPDFYRRLQQEMSDFLAYGKTSLFTLVANNRGTTQNILNNLPFYAFTPPLNILRDRFKGFPAILIAAGPSLSRNRHLLPEAKGKAVLISVATMLKPLLADGVAPDYVTILDYHEISRRFLEGVGEAGGAHLVAEPKVTWHALDAYEGLMSVLRNPFADNCLRGLGMRRDGLRAGATVAHLGFYLAEYMGCDPIILVGQDLGYADGVYYTPGTAIHDIWRGELNRFQTLEMKEWERITRRKRHLMEIEDIHGRTMFTDDQMHTYLQQFVRDFHNTSHTVIDASEGGAKKEGAVVMSLADALDRYATRPIPPEQFEYKGELAPWRLDAREDVLTELEARIDETAGVKALSEETVRVLEEMLEHIEDQDRVNQLMERIDAIRQEISGPRQKQHELLAGLGQTEEIVKFRRDKQIAALQLEGIEKQRKQLERDIEYVGAVIGNCDTLTDMLEEALARVREFKAPGDRS
jgi:hypothetical protein